MRIWLIIGVWLLMGTGFAQRPKLYHFIDSSDFKLSNYSVDQHGGRGQQVDPEYVDLELLNNLVHQELNIFRRKKRLTGLGYDSTLQRIAHYNVKSSSTGTFTSRTRATQRFSRELRRARKETKLPFGICKTGMTQVFTMDYKAGKSYFFYEDEELVYGKRSDVDSNFVPEPIEFLTYDDLAKRTAWALIKSNRLEFLSKYHVAMAVQILYYERSRGKHKVPVLRASVVYGAPRIPIARRR